MSETNLAPLHVDDTAARMHNEFQESFVVPDSRGQINVSPRISLKGKQGFPAADEGTFGKDDEENIDKVEVSIGPQHFDLLKLIGEGAFGKVLMVRNRLDGKFYAMKVISKKLLKKKNNVQYMKSERDILTKIEHPFIVSLWFAFQTEKKIFLVMDFLAGGELFFHLRRRGLIREHEARFYFAEMILAIEFLHNKGVIHRDLKPENVLLRADGNICITDFGLAKEIGDNERARTLCGTSEYMAPEMLTRNGYGKAVDWWSLGALFYEMLCGKAPFVSKNQKELDKKILTEKISCPSFLTANAHLLLKGMLEKDMNKRLGASKSTMFSIGGVAALKQHAFFEALDWVALLNLELEPPIDIGIDAGIIDPMGHHPTTTSDPTTVTPASTGMTTGAGPHPGGVVSPGTCAIDPTAMLTKHFHEGFTTQQISLSVVEDSPRANNNNNNNNNNNTGINNINSESCSERDPNEDDDDKLYDGFDYVDSDFTCTSEQVRNFETELAVKQAKAAKKKKMKVKKDEERQGKQRAEERERTVKEDEDKKKKEAENDLIEKEQKRKIAVEHQAAAARDRQLKIQKRAEMQKALDEHAEKVDKVEKKIKNLRKKLRDISELEVKVASGQHKPSTEQQEKLNKKQGIEDDIVELEEELEGLVAVKPADIPDDLLNIDKQQQREGEGREEVQPRERIQQQEEKEKEIDKKRKEKEGPVAVSISHSSSGNSSNSSSNGDAKSKSKPPAVLQPPPAATPLAATTAAATATATATVTAATNKATSSAAAPAAVIAPTTTDATTTDAPATVRTATTPAAATAVAATNKATPSKGTAAATDSKEAKQQQEETKQTNETKQSPATTKASTGAGTPITKTTPSTVAATAAAHSTVVVPAAVVAAVAAAAPSGSSVVGGVWARGSQTPTAAPVALSSSLSAAPVKQPPVVAITASTKASATTPQKVVESNAPPSVPAIPVPATVTSSQSTAPTVPVSSAPKTTTNPTTTANTTASSATATPWAKIAAAPATATTTTSTPTVPASQPSPTPPAPSTSATQLPLPSLPTTTTTTTSSQPSTPQQQSGQATQPSRPSVLPPTSSWAARALNAKPFVPTGVFFPTGVPSVSPATTSAIPASSPMPPQTPTDNIASARPQAAVSPVSLTPPNISTDTNNVVEGSESSAASQSSSPPNPEQLAQSTPPAVVVAAAAAPTNSWANIAARKK